MNPLPFNIVLFQPEIPNNTGAVGRICVGTGSLLHLVRPLGFRIDDKAVRRAGLDYWKDVELRVHDSLKEALATADRVHYFSTKGARLYTDCSFQPGDYLVFGRETAGLPRELLARRREDSYTIPIWGPIRSHNLANAVAIIIYEAFRQVGFPPKTGDLPSAGQMP